MSCEAEMSSDELNLQGFKDDQIDCELYLNLRYDGTDVAMMTKRSSEEDSYEKVGPGFTVFSGI